DLEGADEEDRPGTGPGMAHVAAAESGILRSLLKHAEARSNPCRRRSVRLVRYKHFSATGGCTMGLFSFLSRKGPPPRAPVRIASPEFKAAPFPFYARLRAEEPVYRLTLLNGEP